jgi:hypothetical protein
MRCASKFTYLKRSAEEVEEVDESELQGDFLSGVAEEVKRPASPIRRRKGAAVSERVVVSRAAPPSRAIRKPRPPGAPTGKVYRHEIDTNMMQVELSCLSANAEIATGDPTFCVGCRALLNSFSKLVE